MKEIGLVHDVIKSTCKKCGYGTIRKHYLGDSTMLWDLYCIKCLEKFLDDNLGKMEKEILNGG